MKKEMKNAVNLIQKLYKTEDGGAGGYAHIVFDDGNVSDENVKFCIKESLHGKYEFICEATRWASYDALLSIWSFTEDQREQAIISAKI